MAQRDFGERIERVPGALGRLGTHLQQAGVVVAVVAAVVTVGAGALVVAREPTVAAGLDAAVASLGTPLLGLGGVPWLVHVGVAGAIVGVWALGLGLILEGIFE